MSRLTALCLNAAIALLALPVFAQHSKVQSPMESPATQVVQSLLEHGYVILKHERTWLGRGRILAKKDGMQREVVFNPGTGEILRDYAYRLASTAPRQSDKDPAQQAQAVIADSHPVGPPVASPGDILPRDIGVDLGIQLGDPISIGIGVLE